MKPSRKNFRIGLFLSGILTLIFLLMIRRSSRPLSDLAPNEIGDTLSGLLAPIAIVWVVLGFRQQSEELRLNTKALNHQATELEQTRKIHEQDIRIAETNMNQESRSQDRLHASTRLSNFVSVYPLVYESLCFRCASICRLNRTNRHMQKLWYDNWRLYGAGYRDVFANTVKNTINELGEEEFCRASQEFFGSLWHLTDFCTRMEDFLRDASVVDESGLMRSTLEYSGLGSAYIAVCSALNRTPKLIKRSESAKEVRETISPKGFPAKRKSRIAWAKYRR